MVTNEHQQKLVIAAIVRLIFDRHKKTGRRFYWTLPVLEIWWRRGELNPRPQVLRHKVYMLISLFNLANDYPSSQENHQRFRKVLAHPHRTDFSAILCK